MTCCAYIREEWVGGGNQERGEGDRRRTKRRIDRHSTSPPLSLCPSRHFLVSPTASTCKQRPHSTSLVMSAESTHAETVDHPDSSSHDPAGQIDPSLSVGGANDAALLDAQLVQLYESAMAAGGVPSLDDPTTGGSAGEGGVVDGAAAVKEEGDGGEDPSASVQGGDQPSGSSSGGDGSHQAGQYSSLFNGNLQGAAFEGLANYAVGPSAG
jgi:hypothetical protein